MKMKEERMSSEKKRLDVIPVRDLLNNLRRQEALKKF